MNLVILTGNQSRHKYFANTLAEVFPTAAIFSEGKVYNPGEDMEGPAHLNSEEKELWKWHFDLAQEEENNFFSAHKRFVHSVVHDVAKGEINSEIWAKKLASYAPNIIAVYGTSLLKGNILDICPDGILNMHLGLSPYYRGSATNFWPFYNNEPEYVGVTIHKIDFGIDTGAIIHQGRPHIEKKDNQHSIGNKAIVVGTRLMIKAIQEVKDGVARFVTQEGKGKLYQRKDFNIEHIRHLKELIEGGMIKKYVERNLKNPTNINIVE